MLYRIVHFTFHDRTLYTLPPNRPMAHKIWVIIWKSIISQTKVRSTLAINLNIRHLMGLYKNALNCLKIIRIINQRKHNQVLVQFRAGPILGNFNSQFKTRVVDLIWPSRVLSLEPTTQNQFTFWHLEKSKTQPFWLY